MYLKITCKFHSVSLNQHQNAPEHRVLRICIIDGAEPEVNEILNSDHDNLKEVFCNSICNRRVCFLPIQPSV